MKKLLQVGLLVAVVIACGTAAKFLHVTQRLKGTPPEPIEITWRPDGEANYFRVFVRSGTWDLQTRYVPEACPDCYEWFSVRELTPGQTAIQWRDPEFPLDFRAVRK